MYQNLQTPKTYTKNDKNVELTCTKNIFSNPQRFPKPRKVINLLSGAPIMPAITMSAGTEYACNLSQDGDRICLQKQSRWGPNMPTISVEFGDHIWSPYMVTYGDHICLQSQIRNCKQIRLQAYLVSNEIVIAGIFGPYYNQN